MGCKEWEEVTLGDVINFRRGHDLPKAKMVEGDYPVVGSNGIIGSHNEYTTEGPCIAIGRSGNVGNPQFINQNFWAHNTTLYIDDFKNTEPKYAYYLLKTLNLSYYGGGSAVPTLNRNHIHPLPVLVTLCREEQKSIAHILSTLDEKIETNNHINQVLEEMAQALFKRWFVDFEFPCLPDGAGKPNLPSGAGKLSLTDGEVEPDLPNCTDGSYNREDMARVCTYKRVGGLPGPSEGKYFVYVLLCDDGSFYKGITKDLYKRFYEHFVGIGAEWTKAHPPVKVIHYEEYPTKEEARKREEELKTGFGRKWLKREYDKLVQDEINLKTKSQPNSSEEETTEQDLSAPEGRQGSPALEGRQGSPAPLGRHGSPAPKTKLRQAGEMVSSELGMIPKGWAVKSLEDFGVITMGVSPSSESYNTIGAGLPLINGASDFNGKNIFATKYTTAPKKITEIGDLIFGVRATIGNTVFADKEYALGRGVASVKPLNHINRELLYFLLEDKMNSLISSASGSVFLNIKKSDLQRVKIACCPEVLSAFNSASAPLIDVILNNDQQNNNLTNLRDTLLPKLMSGEIRVPCGEETEKTKEVVNN